jgi:hypothetical protein
MSARVFAAALLALGLALVAVPAASADPYVLDICKNWDTDAATPGLQGIAAYGPNVTITNGCAGGSISHEINIGSSTSNIPITEGVGFAIAVPLAQPNVTIGQVWSVVRLHARTNGSDAFMEFLPNGQRPDTTTVIQFPQPGQPAIVPNPPVMHVAPAATRTFNWHVFCANNSATAPTACTWGDPAIFDLLKARVFLNESVAPQLTVTGGTLLSPGPRQGQETVAFNATDGDSGVASVTVSLDSTVVGQSNYPCPHADWSACPTDRTDYVLIADTTKVADGSHTLTVVARDAANNAVTRSLGTVIVANGAAPGAGAPNGQGASRLAKLTARFAKTKRRSRTLTFTGSPKMTGSLEDEHGAAIAGARVDVLARQRRAGAQSIPIASVTTDADGAFAYKLPGGPARTITFSYAAFSGDAKPAATAVLRVLVHAPVTAKAAPRSPRARDPFTISGRVVRLPRAGVQVTIQARDGKRWRTVDSVKTRANGRYTWHYRFKASAGGHTFSFRARVDSPLYPFTAGNSRSVIVRVR